jgi:hypothetical protein
VTLYFHGIVTPAGRCLQAAELVLVFESACLCSTMLGRDRGFAVSVELFYASAQSTAMFWAGVLAVGL